MYADPKLIKKRRIVLYLDDYQYDDLQRQVEVSGGELGVIARERYLLGSTVVKHATESLPRARDMRVPHQAFA